LMYRLDTSALTIAAGANHVKARVRALFRGAAIR
jgi:hypothetical protein